MRVCVVGLGAVGGLVAGRLARGGVEVSAVARGATLEAVRRHGLRLVDDEQETAHPIPVAEDPGQLDTPDLVVLAVKTTALESAAPTVRRLLGPETVVMSTTNGIPWWFFDGLPGDAGRIRLPSLDPRGMLREEIPDRCVLGSAVHVTASTPEPGVTAHGFGQGVIVGEPAGPDSSGRAGRVAAVLRAGGFEVEVSDRIQRDIWVKLWGNMTMNPLSAVTGATMDRILGDPLLREFATRCMREAAEIGDRIGLPVGLTTEERHAITARLGAARTSMLQDVELGRPIELDALVTAVVELGAALDVPTPDLDTLLGLTRLHARVRGLYPDRP